MKPYDKIIELLQFNGIFYQEFRHDPVYSTEDAAKIRGLSLDEGAKSLLIKAKNEFVLVVLSGSKKLDSKKLKKSLGVRELRFATPAEVNQQMGCLVGACYPFGSLCQLQTYVDKSLINQSNISLNPGVHHKSLRIELIDFLQIESPLQVDIAAN